MANTLTALRPVYFEAAHVVSRELTGMIMSANTSFDSKGAALNESIKVPRIGAKTASTFSPSATLTTGSDTTPTTDDLTLSNTRQVSWHLNHEDMHSLENAGNFAEFQRQQAQESMRTLANEVEEDLWQAAYQGASRATGTAATTPFASNLDPTADVMRILDDNGAPGDRSLVVNTAAGANLRKRIAAGWLAGADATTAAQTGAITDINGLVIRQSGKIALHTKGTGSGYLINNASGEAVGQTTLTLDTGSGTILAGDIVTHASDSANKYVVNTALASNDIVIGRPGLRVAAADNDAITVGNDYTPNVAFSRNALAAVIRPPIIHPTANISTLLVGDPETGLTFLLTEETGKGRTSWFVHLLWGVKAIQSEHIAILMG